MSIKREQFIRGVALGSFAAWEVSNVLLEQGKLKDYRAAILPHSDAYGADHALDGGALSYLHSCDTKGDSIVRLNPYPYSMLPSGFDLRTKTNTMAMIQERKPWGADFVMALPDLMSKRPDGSYEKILGLSLNVNSNGGGMYLLLDSCGYAVHNPWAGRVNSVNGRMLQVFSGRELAQDYTLPYITSEVMIPSEQNTGDFLNEAKSALRNTERPVNLNLIADLGQLRPESQIGRRSEGAASGEKYGLEYLRYWDDTTGKPRISNVSIQEVNGLNGQLKRIFIANPIDNLGKVVNPAEMQFAVDELDNVAHLIVMKPFTAGWSGAYLRYKMNEQGVLLIDGVDPNDKLPLILEPSNEHLIGQADIKAATHDPRVAYSAYFTQESGLMFTVIAPKTEGGVNIYDMRLNVPYIPESIVKVGVFGGRPYVIQSIQDSVIVHSPGDNGWVSNPFIFKGKIKEMMVIQDSRRMAVRVISNDGTNTRLEEASLANNYLFMPFILNGGSVK